MSASAVDDILSRIRLLTEAERRDLARRLDGGANAPLGHDRAGDLVGIFRSRIPAEKRGAADDVLRVAAAEGWSSREARRRGGDQEEAP